MTGTRRLEAIHVVRTPEYVEFEFPVAGLMSRTLAWLIDVALSSTLACGLIVVLWLGFAIVPGVALALTFITWFVVMNGYFLFCEYRFAGRTIGKRALGLRVLQDTGVRVGFHHSALRNLLRPVDNLPLFYLVGGMSALLSPRARRLGDVAAGTFVVRERKRKLPASLTSGSHASERLLSDKHLEERVRRASTDERELLISSVLRRDELSLEARLSLFSTLSRFVCERFSTEKPEHLSDEKFVVEVTSVLLRATEASPRRTQAVSGAKR